MGSASSASRYQRRIFGLGALGTVLLLVIGAPIFNNRIEDDLERRVPSELAEAGFSRHHGDVLGSGRHTPLRRPTG